MASNFTLNKHTVHLWRVALTDFATQEKELLSLLSPDEVQRAERFRFNIHRVRYLTARAMLRKILSLYINIAPEKIIFSYGKRGKPYLRDNPLDLQFNLSHSEDMAVYALTQQEEIGVDIEKMSAEYKESIAKRFFSSQEYLQLAALSKQEQIVGFYHLWARKEAVIKALGEGLFAPLADFSVSAQEKVETLVLTHAQKEHSYHIESFNVHPDYQAAFATSQTVENIFYWEWTLTGPQLFNIVG